MTENARKMNAILLAGGKPAKNKSAAGPLTATTSSTRSFLMHHEKRNAVLPGPAHGVMAVASSPEKKKQQPPQDCRGNSSSFRFGGVAYKGAATAAAAEAPGKAPGNVPAKVPAKASSLSTKENAHSSLVFRQQSMLIRSKLSSMGAPRPLPISSSRRATTSSISRASCCCCAPMSRRAVRRWTAPL